MSCLLESPTIWWSQETAKQTVAAWAKIFGSSDPLHYQTGATVFQKGEEACNVFLLVRGLVLLYCDLPSGMESVLGVRFPGQIIDQCAHDLQMPYPLSARAVLPSTIYRISVSDLQNREHRNCDSSRLFERLLRIDLYNAAVFISDLKASTIAYRLERFLKLLASSLGRPPVDGALYIPVPLRDEQLGDMLGCSLRHLRRVKSQMKQAGRLRVSRNRTFVLTVG